MIRYGRASTNGPCYLWRTLPEVLCSSPRATSIAQKAHTALSLDSSRTCQGMCLLHRCNVQTSHTSQTQKDITHTPALCTYPALTVICTTVYPPHPLFYLHALSLPRASCPQSHIWIRTCTHLCTHTHHATRCSGPFPSLSAINSHTTLLACLVLTASW